MSSSGAGPTKGKCPVVFLIAVWACLLGGAAEAVWAQPPHYFAGNGHYYEGASSAPGDWASAKAYAESRSYLGVPGHLATITSQAENDFVASMPGGYVGSYWLGGYQPGGSGEPDGNWQWVTGEAWGFTAWGPGQPDNQASEMWINFVGTPNPNLTAWIDPGPTDNRFAFQFAGEPVVDLVFPVNNPSSMNEVIAMLNAEAGYSVASVRYDMSINLFHLTLTAADPGAHELVILPQSTVDILDELSDFEEISQGGAAEDTLLFSFGPGTWSDHLGGLQEHLMVEYPVPEPTVALLLTGGVLALVHRKRRLRRSAGNRAKATGLRRAETEGKYPWQ